MTESSLATELTPPTGVDPGVARRLRDRIVARRTRKVTYVITAAQNATPVHPRGWKALLNYCKHTGAQLLVIPFRYRNPTSRWSKTARADDWWADEVLPYLINLRVDLNKHLVLLADIMTQPTAMRPLEGFESVSSKKSAIIGHTKLELTTIPAPQARLPKILTTTGAITKKNYIPSKAGKKGEFHHTFGACIAEINGEAFHIRQINMLLDGSFCDLLTEYSEDTVTNYPRIPALVMGDTHVEYIDPTVVEATFTNPNSIVNILRPEQLIWHDVYNGAARNWHDRSHAFREFAKWKSGKESVEAELTRTLEFIDRVTPPWVKNIFVASNHNDWLRNWVEDTDPRKDPVNCMFWAETFLAIAKAKETAMTPAGVTVADAFAYWGMKRLKTAGQAAFLRRDQPYQIKGIEISYHGDKGPGGMRGSRMAFRKIGVKSILGHAHAPGITEGAYQVGTSSFLNLTYAAGSPSAWLHTHCIIYPNGKRSLITIIDGKWRA